MIAALIRWSVMNRLLVLLATVMLGAWGAISLRSTAVDALPDLSSRFITDQRIRAAIMLRLPHRHSRHPHRHSRAEPAPAKAWG